MNAVFHIAAGLAWCACLCGATPARWAVLSYETLPGADFSGQDLSGWEMEMTDLSKANLQGANFSRAKVDRAEFTDADL